MGLLKRVYPSIPPPADLYHPGEQRGSTSLLQRALGIGYGKASRFIDYMAEDGLVGAYNGSNARQVMLTHEEWEARKKAAVS